jgi:hypothetical protein
VEHKELTSRSDSPDPAEQGRERIARCCHIHHPKLGSDPQFKSVPFVNCMWCQSVKALYESSQQKEKEKEKELLRVRSQSAQPDPLDPREVTNEVK